jgi:CDP-glucose 4,6-dehydratase
MFWDGKCVFVTGHTGFKGSWLSLWLQRLGAKVTGYSLEPPTEPNLFGVARIAAGMNSIQGDVRDFAGLQAAMTAARPEIVFHLAAQSLVRRSYELPLETYTTNVIGTANLLQAVRAADTVRAVVAIATDKCYDNREWDWAYREIDRLGGCDPYSSSKACAEFVVSAYRSSFFPPQRYADHRVSIASARAGNVIGGGDWARDRLVPDIVRALSGGRRVKIRNPQSTRPWQHVLEPLRGYLILAERLYEHGAQYGDAWNFGPEYSDLQPVEWVVRRLAELWGPEAQWEADSGEHPHEAQMLRVDWSKAAARLGWRPLLRLSEALEMTVAWYKAWTQQKDMRTITTQQIEYYGNVADSRQRAAVAGVGE